MRQQGWRIALMAALILLLGSTLVGWPAPALGQDATPEAGGDAGQVSTPEGGQEAGQVSTPEVSPGAGQVSTPEVSPDTGGQIIVPEVGQDTGSQFSGPIGCPPIVSDGLTGTPEADGEAGESEGELSLWCEPFNVSKSGAASLPALAAEPDGTLHAVWWDEFDGTKVSYYTPEEGWSEPKTATQIIGGRVIQEGKSVRIAPAGLRLLASSSGWVHAFWLDSKNNLRYARSRSGSGNFALGPTLATNPLIWDVSMDSSEDLHLIFIRSDNTPAQPAGVYYRVSANDGAGWRSPIELATSLYFRSMSPDTAFVRAAGDGHGLVLAAWDDAELRRGFYAVSDDGGQSFEAPIQVEQLDQDVARRPRVFPASDLGGAFLRLWEAGDACALYQQQLGAPAVEAGATPEATDLAATEPPFGFGSAWSDPVRVFDSLDGCLSKEAFHLLSDGRLLAVLNVSSSRPLLATWDGERWSDLLGLQISFVEAVTNRPITLDCLGTALAGEQMAVVGCDQFGDVWVTLSQLPLAELLPALTTAWSAPRILSGGNGDAGLPAATVDSEGQLYTIWNQSPAPDRPAQALVHTNSDGVNWPGPVAVLEAGDGQVEMPVVAAGPGGLLHLVWSGGYTGQIRYSQSFVRDARVPTGWATPRELPAPRAVGGWPDLAVSADGALHVVYSVPLNEDRGVYYTRSTDQGNTWSDYTRVFDGAQAGWAMVRGTRLTVDSSGRLHLVWVRGALPGAGTSLGVYYARSDDGGQSWTEPVEIGGVDSDNPRVVVAAPDQLHIAWTRPTSAGLEIVHQWSPDGGQTWSRGAPLLGLRRISAPDFGLVADGSGTVYMVGIERSRQNSASLFYLRWDGVSWVDRESVPLGYDPAPNSGATGVLLPGGTLGVFYRVRAPAEGGGARYVAGYVSRPVAPGQAAPPATFTPQPVASQFPGQNAGATLTPLPTPDIADVASPTVDNTVRTQIGVALAVIVLISGFAVFRLWRGGR